MAILKEVYRYWQLYIQHARNFSAEQSACYHVIQVVPLFNFASLFAKWAGQIVYNNGFSFSALFMLKGNSISMIWKKC